MEGSSRASSAEADVMVMANYASQMANNIAATFAGAKSMDLPGISLQIRKSNLASGKTELTSNGSLKMK